MQFSAFRDDTWQIFGKFAFDAVLQNAEIANHRIDTGDLWWAWVDLNHRRRPYQGSAVWFYKNLQDRGDCQTPRKSYKATQIVGSIVG